MKYEAQIAVRSFNLEIKEGEIFAFLGPSGCGKTTLLRLLAGFENPCEGRIFLNGEDITTVPPHGRSSITMVFQSYALFPHMTVEKNIAFGLQNEGLSRRDIQFRVAEAMHMLEIQDFAKRKPHQLSGGQQQRVALARALAKKPRILLLDEPLTALDKRLRSQAQMDLLRLQKKTKATFILVTHDQEEAMVLASRIAVLDHGILKQMGTPNEIYERPNSRYVASFFGDVNLFDGIVTQYDSEICEFFCPLLGTTLKAPSLPSLSQGQSMTLAVRPEKMMLYRTPPQNPDNLLSATLVDIHHKGPLVSYHCQLACGVIANILRPNIEPAAADPPFNKGAEIYLNWPLSGGRLLPE